MYGGVEKLKGTGKRETLYELNLKVCVVVDPPTLLRTIMVGCLKCIRATTLCKVLDVDILVFMKNKHFTII